MSETLKETITVASLGKWGPKVGDVYYSYSKNFKEQGKLVPGGTYDIETWVSDGGKRYVNKLLASGAVAPVAKVDKATKAAPAPVSVSRDFDKEARGKTRCALYEAALQCPAMQALTTPEDISSLALALAEAGFKYVFQVEK